VARRRVEDPYIAEAERRYGIPSGVLNSLIGVESGGNAAAVSPTGARGETQFEPGTARTYGVHFGTSPGAIKSQILGAGHYLSDLGYAKNPRKALASYNAGPGNFQAGLGYADKVLGGAKGSTVPLPGQPTIPGITPVGSQAPEPNPFDTLLKLNQFSSDDPNDTSTQNLQLLQGLWEQKNPGGTQSGVMDLGLGGSVGSPDVPHTPAQMAHLANKIGSMRIPYKWGGGHGSTPAAPGDPVDCSGFVSQLLGVAPRVSGDFENFGDQGRGHSVTIYANSGHVLLQVGHNFYGTSRQNPGGGPGKIARPSKQYLSQFVARHPRGM
jgi:hypothetical protein